MKPTDGPAIRDTLLLVVAMVGLASVLGSFTIRCFRCRFFLHMEFYTGRQWTLAGMSAVTKLLSRHAG